MSTTPRVTIAQYEAMIRRGDFEPAEAHRVERLRGEIVPMSPIGPRHHNTVAERLAWSFATVTPQQARIFAQGPIGIPAFDSEPEPDLVGALPGEDSERLPGLADVLLVVEVADTSLARDPGAKARLYAEAGLRDYWLVNLVERRIEVHRDPEAGAYRSVGALGPGEEARPLAFPDVVLPVDRLFPG